MRGFIRFFLLFLGLIFIACLCAVCLGLCTLDHFASWDLDFGKEGFFSVGIDPAAMNITLVSGRFGNHNAVVPFLGGKVMSLAFAVLAVLAIFYLMRLFMKSVRELRGDE